MPLRQVHAPGLDRRYRGARSHRAGGAAEESVARHYSAAGLGVADRRWRGQSGEIDLVTQDGDGLVFVEVKQARSFAQAAERVTQRQIARITAAASEYLARMPLGQATPVRFDVALVNGTGEVQVLENAF
ncbi:MAG: YraN family protein [Pseudomonadota bacterium]